MIQSILLALITLVQLSCGGDGSGGGTSSGRGRRTELSNLSSFDGIITASRNLNRSFQAATDGFMSAVIDPSEQNFGSIIEGPDVGVIFKGNLKHSSGQVTRGSWIQLVIIDSLREDKGGVFTALMKNYAPPADQLDSEDDPYVNLARNGRSDCVGTFKAYFQDSFGDITVSGESFFNSRDQLRVRGTIEYENDKCYCHTNSCPRNNYCQSVNRGNGVISKWGDFEIPYTNLFQTCRY